MRTKVYLILLAFALSFLPFLAFSQETLTITTYYPSPYGSYSELRAQHMAIGQNYINRSTACWDPPCPGGGLDISDNATRDIDLIVEGNVGIGTTSPKAKLHVAGTSGLVVGPFTTYEGSGSTEGRIEVSGANSGFVFVNRNLNSWTGSGAGDRFQWYNVNNQARLWTDFTGDIITVTSDGKVGIGTTSPATLLNVVGPNVSQRGQISIDSQDTQQITFYSNGAQTAHIYYANSTGLMQICNQIAGECINLDNTRTIGLIGTVTAGGGSANKAICWKSDGKTLGYCSTLVDAGGSCACN